MSDFGDDQDLSESLDEDKLGGDYPPERPLAVDRGDDSEPGTAGLDARDTYPLEVGSDDPELDDDITPAQRQADVLLVDQTADADPDAAPLGSAELDAAETGDSMDGILSERDPDEGAFASDLAPPPAEEAAMHIVEP